jgi:hypothetical protein
MIALTGQLVSVVVDDWEVHLVVQDTTPHLDSEALKALQGHTVHMVLVTGA